MFQKTREALDQLDAVLANLDGVAEEVWAVLTALRSDDGLEEPRFKLLTTAHIRAAAFPKLDAEVNREGYVPRLMTARSSFPGMRRSDCPWTPALLFPLTHSTRHTLRAAEVLDLPTSGHVERDEATGAVPSG